MDQSEDQFDWLYEYIFQFLKSPSWRVPILSFIDQHCYLFQDAQQNRLQYTPIFNQFQQTIDLLLQSLCRELGINQQQFVDTYQKGMKNPYHRKVFDQILACSNFISFKKLMVKRNKELNQQALKALAAKGQASPQSVREATIQRQEAEMQHYNYNSQQIGAPNKSKEEIQEEELQRAIHESQKSFKEEQLQKLERKYRENHTQEIRAQEQAEKARLNWLKQQKKKEEQENKALLQEQKKEQQRKQQQQRKIEQKKQQLIKQKQDAKLAILKEKIEQQKRKARIEQQKLKEQNEKHQKEQLERKHEIERQKQKLEQLKAQQARVKSEIQAKQKARQQILLQEQLKAKKAQEQKKVLQQKKIQKKKQDKRIKKELRKQKILQQQEAKRKFDQQEAKRVYSPPKPKQSPLPESKSDLPPIQPHNRISLNPFDLLLQHQNPIPSQTNRRSISPQAQTLEERQQRLKKQRDELLKRKQQEREMEMKAYLQNGGSDLTKSALENLSEEELQKRKSIFQKMKSRSQQISFQMKLHQSSRIWNSQQLSQVKYLDSITEELGYTQQELLPRDKSEFGDEMTLEAIKELRFSNFENRRRQKINNIIRQASKRQRVKSHNPTTVNISVNLSKFLNSDQHRIKVYQKKFLNQTRSFKKLLQQSHFRKKNTEKTLKKIQDDKNLKKLNLQQKQAKRKQILQKIKQDNQNREKKQVRRFNSLQRPKKKPNFHQNELFSNTKLKQPNSPPQQREKPLETPVIQSTRTAPKKIIHKPAQNNLQKIYKLASKIRTHQNLRKHRLLQKVSKISQSNTLKHSKSIKANNLKTKQQIERQSLIKQRHSLLQTHLKSFQDQKYLQTRLRAEKHSLRKLNQSENFARQTRIRFKKKEELLQKLNQLPPVTQVSSNPSLKLQQTVSYYRTRCASILKKLTSKYK